MSYKFAEHTHPQALIADDEPLPVGVRLPKFLFDEELSDLELDNGGMWIGLRVHLPTKRGYGARPSVAGMLVFPDGQVWLDEAGVDAVSRAAAKQGMDTQRYVALALLEAARAARVAVGELAPDNLHLLEIEGPVARRRTEPARQHADHPRKWPPRTAEDIVKLAQLDRRVATHHSVEMDGSLRIEVDDLLLIIEPDPDTFDAEQRWFWYVTDLAGIPEHDESGEVHDLEDLLGQIDRWLGALEGPYGITRPIGARVRERMHGMTGKIIRYVQPVGLHDRRSYGIRWDNGTAGAGWREGDLDP